MRRLVVVPDGWPCDLQECPPGLFVYGATLCWVDAYDKDPYTAEDGQAFWGGTSKREERAKLIVQPCKAIWEEYEA